MSKVPASLEDVFADEDSECDPDLEMNCQIQVGVVVGKWTTVWTLTLMLKPTTFNINREECRKKLKRV